MANEPYCPDCGHPPIRHIPDGAISVCLVCMLLAREKNTPAEIASAPVCTRKFTFNLPAREREQAILADKEAFPMHAACEACGCEWCQHMGFLCPSGDSLFKLYIPGPYDLVRKSDIEN